MIRQSPHSSPARTGALLMVPVLVAACAGPAPEAPAPEAPLEAAARTVTAADVAAKMGALAHDSTAGRDTPSPELEATAAYLAARFEALGLEPAGDDGGYIARFEMTKTSLDPAGTRLSAGDGYTAEYGDDYFLVPPPARVQAGAYYVGTAGEAGPPPAEARGKILVYDHPIAEVGEEWQQRLMASLQTGMMSGAPALLFVLAPEFDVGAIPAIAGMTAQQQAPFGLAGLSYESAAGLFAELGQDLDEVLTAGLPVALGETPITIEGERTTETFSPPNVAAMVRGSDPALRDSYVVLTAHFDHLGVGSPDETGDSIYNGADDNASGTAAVLEVAEAFAALDEAPARSVVFLMVSGEEDGLLGSRAWVEDPTVDIDAVIANINLDMVGRNATDTIIGIGQEYTTLQGVLQEIVASRPGIGLNVILDPVPEERFFFRSDQLPFIQHGIPAVFFTGHEHEDYHQRSDEADRIDNEKIARVARLSFYLAHAIASNPIPPEYTEEGKTRLREMLGQGSPF